MSDFHTDSVNRLYHAITLLKTEEECSAFFEDLCTIPEIQAMAQRLDTAILLDQGENYQNISKDIGTSTATISRVNRCIQYGSGGYTTIIERLKEEK